MKRSRKPRTSLLLAFGLALVCLLGPAPGPVHAGTITVDITADEQDDNCYDGDCSLRDAINTAAAVDTIEFAAGLSGATITLSIGQLDVTRDLTIDGSALAEHIVISGDKTFRVFEIQSGATVTLNHIDIVLGQSPADWAGGGGIYNEGDLTLINCTVADNAAADHGGGISSRAGGRLTVDNCSFSNNSTSGNGGGILSDSNAVLLMTGSSFIGNSSANGGAIQGEGPVTVSDSAFSSNTASGNGGGILNEFGATLSVTNSTFTGNAGSYGGGIRNQGTLTMSGSTVSGNTADFGGGIDNYAGTTALNNTTLDGNTAAYYGGGITSSAPLTANFCTFTDNSAQSGGGIDNHGPDADLAVNDSTFTGNIASVNGGALLNDEAAAEVTDTTFDTNSAGTGGGGIFNADTGTLTVTDSTLTGNTASGTDTGWGGGIFNYGTLTLNGGFFWGNIAHLHGGGIWNWEGELTINRAFFGGNSAEDNGGAIANNSYSNLAVTSSTFDSNSADSGGAILNDNGSTITLENSTLSANSAIYDGGGLWNVSGTVTVNNSTFDRNASASTGGGVDNSGGSLTLNNCTLSGNSADAVGGGIFNGTLGTLNVRNTLIAGSPNGGDCVSDGAIGDNINNLIEDGGCAAAFSGVPGLASLEDNGGPTETHALLPGSPAIDAGDDATCLAADQRGATRPTDGDADGTAACDIGAFELGGLRCGIHDALEPADYIFLGNVTLRVTDDGIDLDCLRVTDIPWSHPAASLLLRTGRYWQIAALTDDPGTAATADYLVDLTLPYGAADDDDTVCRYTGYWHCAATSYVPDTSVTRTGIDQLSDWAVDSGACEPAAVPDPGINLTGTQKHDVLLSWADAPANASGYQVHRSRSPYFAPSAGTLRATRPAGSTSYTDTGAAGTAGISYFYIIRGLSNCGEPSDDSRRLGMFSFKLLPGQ